MTQKIDLGDIVKDDITGFEGVAIRRTTYLSNVDRIVINPQMVKDGKPVENRSFDATQVTFVRKSDVRVIPIERSPDPVSCGDVVKHQLCGLEGVAVAITTWVEGCCIVAVQPRELKDGLPVEPAHFDERMLDIVTKKNPPAPAVRTGGPRTEPTRSFG